MLKYNLDNLDTVDEQYKGLYKQTDNGFVLDTDAPLAEDFGKAYSALQKERTERKELEKQLKETNEKLKSFKDIDVNKYNSMVAELDNFKNSTDNVIHIKQENAEYKIQLEQLQKANENVLQQLAQYEQERSHNNLINKVTSALKKANISEYALEDALLHAEKDLTLAEDGSIVVKSGINNMQEGMGLNSWVNTIKSQKPYYFGGSIGGGSNGSVSTIHNSNTWTKNNGEINITKLAQALANDKDGTISALRANGTLQEVKKNFPYLF